MNPRPRLLALASAVLLMAAAPFVARAAEFSATQRSEIGTIVHD